MNKSKKFFEVGYYSWIIKNGLHTVKTQIVLAKDLSDAREVFAKKINCAGIDYIREFSDYIE